MAEKVVEEASKQTKYQVYLSEELHNAFQRYMQENFPGDSRVTTAIIRKALAQFLQKEGYYGTEDESH